ncbi:MAG: diadenylate cyclase, partial [Pseudomonadota bacterium]
LDNLLSYFIIIVIVVFQYDIRRGLVNIGRNLFAFTRTYEETHVLEEALRAAEYLSKARIGALIVFERQAELSEFAAGGEVLDAKVTRELLVSLFIPSRDNPLHDGAVVIRSTRIHRAGALLPLSTNPRMDKALGTRHRAAIGLTEETDAVVLVVSEERGEVSLCFQGNIARNFDSATLRKALFTLFAKEKRRQRDVVVGVKAAAAAAEAVAALAQASTVQKNKIEPAASGEAAAASEVREVRPDSAARGSGGA